jgi:hypothetical protein
MVLSVLHYRRALTTEFNSLRSTFSKFYNKENKMKTKETTVHYARTLNLGNYESLRVEFGETVTLDAKEKIETVRAELFKKIKGEVSEIIRGVKGKTK